MAEDDEGASYYYRGAVKNNYVSFAEFIWRIIRRNGDGSVRMIYAGKKTSDTGNATMIGNSKFNDKYWDPAYIGYKYNEKFSLHINNEVLEYTRFTSTTKYDFGTDYSFDETTKKFMLSGNIKQLTLKDNYSEIVSSNLYSCLNTECNIIYKIISYQNDTTIKVQPISYSSDTYNDAVTNNVNSAVKEMLDNWYKHNMIKYTTYLADGTFCNDRSVISGTRYLVTSLSRYGPYNRLVSNKSPSLKCTQDNDKFKTSNSSAKLEYPVALITADEVAMAGGRGHHDASYSPNSDFYLYNTKAYWTMSPSLFSSSTYTSLIWAIYPSGSLSQYYKANDSNGVRPVINLKADVKISSGDGTSIAPFKIFAD